MSRKRTTLWVSLFLGIPALGAANVPIPTMFGPLAPVYLTWRTTGLAFLAILLIEFVILWLVLRGDLRSVVKYVLIANVASSLFGVLLAANPCVVFILPVLPFFLVTWRPKNNPSPVKSLQAGALAVFLLLLGWALFTFTSGRAIKLSWLYFSLAPAFAVTVVVEYILFGMKYSARRALTAVITANIASYILLAALLGILSFRSADNPMLSIDYIFTHIDSALKDGDIEEARTFLPFWDDRTSGDDPYYALRDARYARDLARLGEAEMARERLGRLELYSEWRESRQAAEILDYISEAERMLTESQSEVSVP